MVAALVREMPKQFSFRWMRGQSIGLCGELAHLDVTKYLSLQRKLVMKLLEEVSAGHRLNEAARALQAQCALGTQQKASKQLLFP